MIFGTLAKMQDSIDVDIQSEPNPSAGVETIAIGSKENDFEVSAGESDFGIGAGNGVVKRKRAPGGGRKPKQEDELYVPISIRIHPKALEWAKAEAEKRGVGYQSIINEELLDNVKPKRRARRSQVKQADQQSKS